MEGRANADMQQIPAGNNAYARISSKEFASKYKSKREIYSKSKEHDTQRFWPLPDLSIFVDFLACDNGCYLPDYSTTTIYFLKELMGG